MIAVPLEVYKSQVSSTLFKILIFLSVFGYADIPRSFLPNSTQTELVLSNERKVSSRNFSYNRVGTPAQKYSGSFFTTVKQMFALLFYNKLSKVNFDNNSRRFLHFNKAKRFFRKEFLPSNLADDDFTLIAGLL